MPFFRNSEEVITQEGLDVSPQDATYNSKGPMIVMIVVGLLFAGALIFITWLVSSTFN